MTETLQSFKTPHDQLERSDQMQCLRQLMAKLPAKQQEAIHLREIEEYSYQEIAQRMNESETNVKVLIHRARQTLKDAFFKYDNHGL